MQSKFSRKKGEYKGPANILSVDKGPKVWVRCRADGDVVIASGLGDEVRLKRGTPEAETLSAVVHAVMHPGTVPITMLFLDEIAAIAPDAAKQFSLAAAKRLWSY